MALVWDLSELRTKVRSLIGRPSTSQISDADLNDLINDYYQNMFPLEVQDDRLNGFVTQVLAATDSGDYTLAENVLRVNEPVTVNGVEIELYLRLGQFFELFPKDTGSAFVISDAGAALAIGTSSAAAVKNGAFYFSVDGHSYYKATAETALSGDTVPQNKYGAWRLECATDGTISIVAAADNATGYATAALAIAALENESSQRACMGYVTAINTAGTFIPGTTELSAAGVTDTYTDGFHSSRQSPLAALISDQTLYVRPKPDQFYELKAPCLLKPDALSGDSSVPIDVRWGLAIAYGAAIEYLIEKGQTDKASDLNIAFDDFVRKINQKTTRQNQGRVAEPSF